MREKSFEGGIKQEGTNKRSRSPLKFRSGQKKKDSLKDWRAGITKRKWNKHAARDGFVGRRGAIVAFLSRHKRDGRVDRPEPPLELQNRGGRELFPQEERMKKISRITEWGVKGKKEKSRKNTESTSSSGECKSLFEPLPVRTLPKEGLF